MHNHKKKTYLMFLASFVLMFLSTYVMIDILDHFYLNLNKFFMALFMTGLMGIVNPLLMADMYKSSKFRIGVLVTSISVSVLSLAILRTQTFVGNESFLRAMIPHHSSAILMCEEANIDDPEIKELCDKIVQTQKEEIEIMKEMLEK